MTLRFLPAILLLGLCAGPAMAAPVTIAKSASTKSDPLNNLNPLAIPGAIVEYKLDLTGATTGVTGLEVVDAVPANMSFCLSTFDLVAGPVVFTDTSFLLSSGIGFTYTAVNNGTDGLDFSTATSGTDWSYQPALSATCDPLIKRIRVKLTGTFGGSKTANLRFRMKVK
ncbi:MAG: hypothetical protein ABW048_03325 [Sphingobium sp.]